MPPMGDPSGMGMPPTGDPCMVHPPGPARDTCYSSMSGSSMPPHMPPTMGAPVLTADDPKCDGTDGPPRTNCPNYGMPPTGAPDMMMPPGAPPHTPSTMAPPGTPGMHGDTAALRACKRISPKGKGRRGKMRQIRQKNNCFRDLAKSLGAKQSAPAEWKRCKRIRAKGLPKLRNKKNCFRDLARSLQHGPGPTGTPGMPPTMGAPGKKGKMGN